MRWGGAQSLEYWPSAHTPWAWAPVLHKLVLEVHTCNLAPRNRGVEGSGVQGHLLLHRSVEQAWATQKSSESTALMVGTSPHTPNDPGESPCPLLPDHKWDNVHKDKRIIQGHTDYKQRRRYANPRCQCPLAPHGSAQTRDTQSPMCCVICTHAVQF